MKIMLEEMKDKPSKGISMQVIALPAFIAIITRSMCSAIRANYFFLFMMHE